MYHTRENTAVGAPYVPIKSPIPPPTDQKLRNLENAYPPMFPGLPGRSVYERAGFDVNRGFRGDDSSSTRSRRRRKNSNESNSTTSESNRNLNPYSINNHYQSNNTSATNLSYSSSSGSGKNSKPQPHTPTLHSSSNSSSDWNHPQQDYTRNEGFGAHKKVSLPRISVVTNDEFNSLKESWGGDQDDNYYTAPHTAPNPPPELCQVPTPPHSSANCRFPPDSLRPGGSSTTPGYSDGPHTPLNNEYDNYRNTTNDNESYYEEADDYLPELPAVSGPRPISSASSIYSNTPDPVTQPSPETSSSLAPSRNMLYSSLGPNRHSNAQPQLPMRAPERSSNHNIENYRRKNSQTSSSGSSSRSSNRDSLYSSPRIISTPGSPSSETGSSKFAESTNTPPLFDASNKPTRKKQCRGCCELITGKCVHSKDGRLSGKWHKECFKCSLCHNKFTTAEFYVLNDLPYCCECYHYENNSICQTCGVGIEGQCLETSNNEDHVNPEGKLQRFHLECLTCSHCQVSLADVYYYAADGSTLCSLHADAYSNSKLEKRRTRILVV